MLSQHDADELMAMAKRLFDVALIDFPMSGEILHLEAKSTDGRESFLFDVNRKGKLKPSKCTYQERYAVVDVLLRLDVDGPPHDNPDGETIPCPHLHVYREGYGSKWAIPAPKQFKNTADLIRTLRDFLTYCNVESIPDVQRPL